ncbi:MAG: alpha-ketoglutarate-dependent dioxygenase AlkB [Actinomycetota bacterium]
MTLPLFDIADPEPRLPPGLVLVHEWLSRAESAALLSAVDSQPWLHDLKRRVQHYGWKYDYTLRDLSPDQYLGPIPSLFAEVVDRLAAVPQFGAEAEQIIVNEYLPGQGIAAHIDRATFGEVVASVSLGSEWPMEFSSRSGETIEVYMPVGALLLMTGPSRHEWTHHIRSRKSDTRAGVRVARTRRVSLTFRTLGLQFSNQVGTRNSAGD